MKKWARNVGIGLVVLIAIVLVLPYVVPLGSYRGEIERAAQKATGRVLKIEGPLRITFFPHFGLRADKVNFANMKGGRASAMATFGDIQLSIRLLPLLTGHIAVDKIVLEQPVIAFEVDAAGHENWNFGSTAKPAKGGGTAVTLPTDTQFSGIEIDDGRIAYDNYKTGTHRALEHVNADIAITRLDQPVTLDGNLVFGNNPVDFTVKVATVAAMLGNGTTELDLLLKSEAFKASFKGAMAPDGQVTGDISFSSASLRQATAELGQTLPAGGGFGSASVSAHVVYKEKIATLSPLRLSLDGQNISGNLTLDEHGEIPAIDGMLSADHLDLNPYLASSGANGGGHGGGSGSAPHPQSGWSREPINLALLKSVNAKLTLSTGALRLRELKLGATKAVITVAAGALTAQLDPITLYGGSGHAELDADGRGSVPVFHSSLQFQHVSLSPFLGDALGIDSVEGSGALTLDVTARGSSADAAMHSLSGKGSVSGADGRIRGVDLGAVSRTIQTVLSLGATSHSANTGYHDMGGTFVIQNGVLTTNDFRITGPIIQMTGAGALDIGNRGIDFHLVPKAGVGGLGIGIPFRVAGTWDHVHYLPDLKGIVTGVVGGAANALEQGGATLTNFLGGNSNGQKKQDTTKKKQGSVLQNLFGSH